MKDALGHGSNSTNGDAARALAQGHDKSGAVPTHDGFVQDRYGVWRDSAGNATAVMARVKKGNGTVEYGPHTSREAAVAEAFSKHPKAKSVSTSYQNGRDIRFHNR